MITTMATFKENTRENMAFSISEIKNIPLVNPNIEDFQKLIKPLVLDFMTETIDFDIQEKNMKMNNIFFIHYLLFNNNLSGKTRIKFSRFFPSILANAKIICIYKNHHFEPLSFYNLLELF